MVDVVVWCDGLRVFFCMHFHGVWHGKGCGEKSSALRGMRCGGYGDGDGDGDGDGRL